MPVRTGSPIPQPAVDDVVLITVAQEQFHKEWEYVLMLPHAENPVPKVAGNYGPASNVWAIGMVSQFQQDGSRESRELTGKY